MPLRDHFHPPLAALASWEELHGAWPTTIAFRLNAILPSRFRSGVRVHLGTAVEIDVAAFDRDPSGESGQTTNGSSAVTWEAAAPATLLDTEELTPPEYEVRVYDEQHARRFVAAVEIVSPRNKDWPESRDAFVT